jgi:hypothetical protein
MSELLAGLEDGTWPVGKRPGRATGESHAMFEVHRLVERLKVQRVAMDRTVELLEQRTIDAGRTRAQRATKKRTSHK